MSSPHKPERDLRRSFSTLAPIPAMKVCAQRSLWSAAAAGFPSFAFVKIARKCVLVKALSWWTFSTFFMNIIKLFIGVVSNFVKLL